MRAHEFGSNTTPGGLTQTHLNQYHGIIITTINTTTTSRNGQAGQLADSDPKVFLYYTLKIFRRTNSTFVMSLSLSTVMVFVTFWVRFNKNGFARQARRQSLFITASSLVTPFSTQPQP